MFRHFFFGTSLSPSWLRLFRMGVGLILLLSAIQLWPDLGALYGADSLVDHRLFHLNGNGGSDAFLAPIIGPGYLAVYGVLCIALIVGRYARWIAAGLCLLHQAMFIAQPAFSYGFDYLAASAIFYCIWFPVDRPASPWATPSLRVLQFHLCLIYFFGGFEKLLGHTWHNGEALWKALHLPDLMGTLRPNLSILGEFPLLLAGMGWLIIILELGYPVAIWIKATRPFWLWGIVGMHASIALLMGLYHFSGLMLVLNLTAFYFPYRKMHHITEQIVTQHHHPARQHARRKDPSEQSLPAPNP